MMNETTSENSQPQTHHLHPSSFVFQLLARIRSYLIPAILAALAAARGGRFFALVLAGAFLLALAADIVRLLTCRYYVAKNELVVRRGLFFRQQRTIPFSRIQNVDLLQNPLHRVFGVAEVRVETASGSEPEATLRVLSLKEVDRLKHQLRGPEASQVVEHPTEDETQVTRPSPPLQRTLLTISPRDLVTLGLISDRGMVLVAVAFGAIYQFELYERIDMRWANQAARAAQQLGLVGAIFVGMWLLLMALITLRLLSVLWFLLRFYDYQLTTDGSNLRVSGGLFTKVSATVPRSRVQFISIHRSLLARWLDRASIRIETAGGDANSDEDARATIARRWFIPIVREQSVAALIDELRPGLAWKESDFAWRGVHPLAGRRLIRRAILFSIGASLIGFLLCQPYGALAGPLLLPAFVWHALRFAASLKYARFEEGVVYRSGVLTKKTSVTFFDKVQVVDVHQTPFDRRWKMAQLSIDTAASGPAEHRVCVALLEEQFARHELSEISRKAAQHMVGSM